MRQVRLTCLEGEKGAATKGTVVWTEFVIAAAVDELLRPPGDATQDELWLAEGDQLFGQVVKADRRGIVVKGLFLKEREGHPAPRIVETPAGMLNAIGLQGIGVSPGTLAGLCSEGCSSNAHSLSISAMAFSYASAGEVDSSMIALTSTVIVWFTRSKISNSSAIKK